jgi:hypothetical protein
MKHRILMIRHYKETDYQRRTYLAYPGAPESAGGNMTMVMAYRRAPAVIRLITGAPGWCASVVIFFRIQKKRI